MDKSKVSLVLIMIVLIVAIGAYAAVSSVLGSVNQFGNLAAGISTEIADALNPTPTILPDPVTIIRSVRSLARLETIQYSIEKIITAEVGQGVFGFLVGDRLLFVAHGDVIAGIDLEKLAPEDLWVIDRILYVDLPTAEIFVATLDNDLSYVYDRDTGLFTKGNIELETLARQAAEEEILKAAITSGILVQAKINAENYLWRLFNTLGYPKIIFVKPPPN
ncbi:MAG: DUF4230 domain-containing protein [Chloroflexi bacterium]|nr:DUF4230 domain-containing protein [Chloroflexota bacterium]